MRKDKARDIARGVLPSAARKGARDNKRNFHSRHRHAQRQANHAIERSLAVEIDGSLAHDPDLYDDFEDPEIYDGYSAATKAPLGWDSDMKYIVDRRRDADKLGPLIRWAEATEKTKMGGWEPEDKVAYFKAVLPDSLQGRHALGHVKSALRLYDDPIDRLFWEAFDNRKNTTVVDFRNALDRCLATKHGRTSLRDLVRESVPVAAHKRPSPNKVRSTETVVDENGRPVFKTLPNGTSYRVTTNVYIPQMIATTCEDCNFLRNDPLATPAAIDRFVSIIWYLPAKGLPPFWARRAESRQDYLEHPFKREVVEHVLTF